MWKILAKYVLPIAILTLLAANVVILRIGLQTCPPEPDGSVCVPADWTAWLAILYRALMLFTLEGNNLDPQFGKDSPVLQVVFEGLRVLTPLVLVGALAKVLSDVWGWTFFRIRRLWTWNTMVVIGLGQIGRMFASTFGKDHVVTAVDLRDSEELRVFCRRHGIRLVVGDGADDDVLKAALPWFSGRVAIVTDSDVRNLEIAGRIRTLNAHRNAARRLHIALHVFDPHLALRLHDCRMPALEDKEGPAILPFSFFTVAARDLLRRTPLHRFADMSGQRRIHAAIFGFGNMGESLFVQIAQSGFYKDFERPRVSILDRNPEACERIIAARHAGIEAACEWAVYPLDLGRTALETCDVLRDVEEADGITASFLCLGAEADNIAAAFDLHVLMVRHRRFLAPVYVRVRRNDGLSDLLRPLPGTAGPSMTGILQPFGLVSDIMGPSGIGGESDTEWLAQIVHHGYEHRHRAEEAGEGADSRMTPERFVRACVDDALKDPAGQRDRWAVVPETHRESSRASADHLRIKLEMLGYEPPDTSLKTWRLPTTPADTILDRLDRLEHSRWMAQKAVAGYRPSEIRDEGRRLHPLMVDYDSLSGEERKDRFMNTLLLRGVLGRPFGPGDRMLRRNVTVGVLSNAGLGDRALPSDAALRGMARLRAVLSPRAGDHRLVVLAAVERPAEADLVRRILDLPNSVPPDPAGPRSTDGRTDVLRCPRFLPVPLMKAGGDPLVVRSDGGRLPPLPEWVIDMVPPGLFGEDYVENHHASPASEPPRLCRSPVADQRARALAYWIERCDVLIHLSAEPEPPDLGDDEADDLLADFRELAWRLFQEPAVDPARRARDWRSLRGYWKAPQRIPGQWSSVPAGRFAERPEVSGLVRMESTGFGALLWVSPADGDQARPSAPPSHPGHPHRRIVGSPDDGLTQINAVAAFPPHSPVP